MEKRYLEIDVYEALQRRLDFLFREFDNIFVSFSGGKDSGLLLHLVMEYKKSIISRKKSACSIRISKRSTRSQQNMWNKPLNSIFRK